MLYIDVSYEIRKVSTTIIMTAAYRTALLGQP